MTFRRSLRRMHPVGTCIYNVQFKAGEKVISSGGVLKMHPEVAAF